MQQLILKSGRDRSLINRHPWVFSGAVKQLPQAENGEMVQVLSNNGQLLGYGFFSPNSQITCRVFEFTAKSIAIDGAFWAHKIKQANKLRQLFINQTLTNTYRLIHAEGDFLPGVI
ncbi:MAG: class I SAM-dependent rRNA methyltransferase, partial [Bacteroidota bacterium]